MVWVEAITSAQAHEKGLKVYKLPYLYLEGLPFEIMSPPATSPPHRS